MPIYWWPEAEDNGGFAPAVPIGVTPGGWESCDGKEGRETACAGKGKDPVKTVGYGINGGLGMPPICGGWNQSPWGEAAIAGKDG